MLIAEALRLAKSRGSLVPFVPFTPWSGTVRALLMCRPVCEAIAMGRVDDDEKVRQRWAALEAAFNHFVEGGRVDRNFLKQLEPYKFEHWTLRNRRPKPSLRVFGRFALPDVFVATHVEERARLGEKWSQEFELEKLVCEDHWAHAGLSDPFTDAPHFRYDRYITSNASISVRVD